MIVLNWKKQESLNEPLALDEITSNLAVYIRQNIEKVETKNDGKKGYKYVYDEAVVNKKDFELYMKTEAAKGVDVTPLGLEYLIKLNTPIVYKNNHLYKLTYIDDYKAIMDDVNAAINLMEKAGGDISGIINKQITIYDATGLVENAVSMTVVEITDLYFYLYVKKEEYYNEYKAKKALI